jgi:PAS domain S-box-containing protein
MGKSDKGSKKENDSQSRDRDLVLTIDKNDKLVKFNKECEKLSGYKKNQILNKILYEKLVPDRYLDKWENMISSSRKEKSIDEFCLPFLTNHGHEIMISWNSFPVKDSQGNVGDIGLVGKIINSWDDLKEIKVDVKHFNEPRIEDIKSFNKIIGDIEKKNLELEKRNIHLESKLNEIKNKKDKKKKNKENLDKVEEEEPNYHTFSLIGKGVYRFSDILGGKKKREEVEAIFKELDQREKWLNKLDSKLTKEKIKVNEQRNEFIKWREKLESLENEIYNREKDIKNKEKIVDEQLNEASKLIIPVEKELEPEEPDEIDTGPDLIDKLSECAAVVQRGIIKHVNESFSELIGYNPYDMVEKSIFDFITPENFSKIENYYLKRLKGGNISSYETVFLTKDNKKVYAEVTSKPTICNGEKAEIVLIKKIDKQISE